jgi:hypothetical protein
MSENHSSQIHCLNKRWWFELKAEELGKSVKFGANGHTLNMTHGSVVIAAITCAPTLPIRR